MSPKQSSKYMTIFLGDDHANNKLYNSFQSGLFGCLM